MTGLLDGRVKKLNADHRLPGLGWEFDVDSIAGLNNAACENDAHDACLHAWPAAGSVFDDGLHEAWAEIIHLDAGVAKPGDFDDCGWADFEERAGWKVEEVEAAGGDVLAHVAGGDVDALCGEF